MLSKGERMVLGGSPWQAICSAFTALLTSPSADATTLESASAGSEIFSAVRMDARHLRNSVLLTFTRGRRMSGGRG